MAQVYQFTDSNGETRLFAEIVPDPAGTPFNGGTITTPLTVNQGFGGQADLGEGQISFSATGADSSTAALSWPQLAINIDAAHPHYPITCSDAATGNALFWVSDAGSPIIGATAAVPDGDLPNSCVSLWLDATVNATKLMVKAKDSAGTVRTAAIALS